MATTKQNILIQYTKVLITNVYIGIGIYIAKAPTVYLSCDKGNKKVTDHLVKVLSYFDSKLTRVSTILYDTSGTAGSSENHTYNIIQTFRSIVSDPSVKLSGQGTDSGGGGVKNHWLKRCGCWILR
jgi:hypothetical protein